MTRHRAHPAGRRARFGPLHVLGLFALYSVLALCGLALAFLYGLTLGELWLAGVLAPVIGAVATVLHVRAGRRTRIDTLID